ncbi:hypothetical protein E3N88_35005 [Mikania micrantha]|uniref:Uncharacterized protein n=1 Tax=Mikania micrantha TaxID=192012 RepID=A0A5N6LZS2_9ASTR|nr:hypothetical protein E3N88_35005 [Mikania micrantha]
MSASFGGNSSGNVSIFDTEQPESIDVFWRKLNFSPAYIDESDHIDYDVEVDKFASEFKEPIVQTKTRGRPTLKKKQQRDHEPLQPPPPPRGRRLVFRDPVLRDQSRRLDRLEDLAAWQSSVLIAFATHLGVQIPPLPLPRQIIKANFNAILKKYTSQSLTCTRKYIILPTGAAASIFIEDAEASSLSNQVTPSFVRQIHKEQVEEIVIEAVARGADGIVMSIVSACGCKSQFKDAELQVIDCLTGDVAYYKAHSNLPLRFWRFAFDTATYLINRLPSWVSSNMSPYQHVFKHKPDYSFLRVFGCQCFTYLRPYNRHKIDFRSTPCIFLGYSPHHHGYRCFDPVSERVYVARHVRFNEHILPSRTPPPPAPPPPSYTSIFPTPPPNLSNSENSPTSTVSSPNTNQLPSAPTPLPPQPADQIQPTPLALSSEPTPAEFTQSAHSDSPTRPRPAHLRPNPKRSTRYNPSACYITTSPDQFTEPTSFTVANKSPEWRHAMNEEFHALNKNGTWSLIPYVDNSNVVDCKWVYRLKRDAQGKVTRYKARLVAKGFHQQADYHETFSPVVKATTIRVVLSLAVTQKWALRQLDVQNAFLHGDLQETVYMRQPQGFVDPSKPHHVCLLHKSLYGLKQAPRAWFHRLSTALQQLGFHGSKTDPSLFILNSRGTILYVLVYVDDIIITGNNNQAVDHIIQSLSSSFAVKDLGSLHYFLGIEVIRHGLDLILSQKKYIWDTLQRSGLSDCKPVNSPMSTSQVLMPDDSLLMLDPTKYRQVVGALQYATLTRPDIAFSVNKVCQFMHAPTDNHWIAVKRILRYLKGTTDLGLRIRHDSGSILHAFIDAHWTNSVQAYSDSDWAGCPVDHRSTGGFAIYLGSNLVSWIAQKQRTVSRSSTESEYKALADTVAELIWLKALLRELGIAKNYSPTLWCDNLGATYLSANPVFHARTKHVEVDYHFVREQVAQGNLHIKFIATNDQIADVFTKPLSSQRFHFLRSKLQVVPRPQLAGEY